MIYRFGSLLLFILGTSVLVGCNSGIAEFQNYQTAYQAQYLQGTQVLDRVAEAERVVERRQRDRDDVIPPFDPDKARYYVVVGDPPITGAIRDSLISVNDFNATLVALATGEAAQALTARAGATAASATSALGAVTAASGALAAESAAFTTAAGAAFTAILPVFQQLAAIEDRAEFRRVLLQAYPDVRKLVVTIRNDATPAMFELIKRSYVVPGSLDDVVDGVPKSDLPRLEQDRRMLAGWVVLLDKTLAAMDRAAAAAADPGSSTDLALLTDASIEVRALAESIRAARFGQ